MCEPTTIMAIVSAATGIFGATQAAKSAEEQPTAASAEAKPSQVQAPRMPDQQAARKAAGTGVTAGPSGAAGTMLTGPGGVSNSLLNLGKNTLLGQ